MSLAQLNILTVSSTSEGTGHLSNTQLTSVMPVNTFLGLKEWHWPLEGTDTEKNGFSTSFIQCHPTFVIIPEYKDRGMLAAQFSSQVILSYITFLIVSMSCE